MDAHRKQWNEQQQVLQRALARPTHPAELTALFLQQHAMVHSAGMPLEASATSRLWSFEDEVCQDLSEQAARCIPPGCEHSIAWLLWHSARCEDITMNCLVAGQAQVLLEEGWQPRLRVAEADTGSCMSAAQMIKLNTKVDLAALREYRRAVGRRTRLIAAQLKPQDYKRKVDPAGIQRIRAEGAVLEAAAWLLDYWGSRTIAGLLTMPATRHHLVHLNEALRVKLKSG